MPEFLDDIAYLSQEIGPRPAGTEEEQQAALYISDRFKKHVGLRAQIEDFSCNSNAEIVNVILCALPIVFSILCMIRNIFVIPAILVSLVCAVLFVMEVLGKPILSRAFQRGVSQNVIAKYRPSGLRGKRSRKIIVVANYDSSKIRNELTFAGLLPFLQKASAISIVLFPVIWIIRAVGFLGATGTPLIVWNVITVIAIVFAALPIVTLVMHNAAQYNEAANSNASGVAALIEVANRIANSPYGEDEPESEADIYGEEAVRDAGLVPEGADIEYRVQANADSEMSESQRLNAAKEAIAALTGKPVIEYAPAPEEDIADKQVVGEEIAVSDEAEAASGQGPAVESKPAVAQPENHQETANHGSVVVKQEKQAPQEESEPSVPDWYRIAQEKAQKPSVDTGAPVRRSKFASALDEAVAVSHEQFAAANRATENEESFFNQHFNNGISEVPAPEQGLQVPSQQPSVNQQTPSQGQAQPRFMSTEEEIANMNFDDYADQPPFDMELYAPKPGDEDYDESVIAADFMVQQFTQPQVSTEEQTAPIQAVPQQIPVEPVSASATPLNEDSSGSTTAMSPIDVSQLRNQAVRNLQAKPSLNVEPAQRRNVNRVVIDATTETSEVVQEVPADQVASTAVYRSTDERSAAQPLQEQRTVAQPAIRVDGQQEAANASSVSSDLPLVDELQKQRAPLADSTKPSLSSQIPRINLDAFGVSTTGDAEPMDNKRAALRNMLPSMSGSITMEPSVNSVPMEAEGSGAVSLTGSFAPISATGNGNVGRVGDELVEGMSEEEMYIDDADDSFTETTMTETGAYAGPGYMEMPESRSSRFFGRFHRKKKKNEDRSAQEWLDVDDDFNPIKVGAARGGWESFGEKDEGRSRSNRHHGEVDEFLDDDWNGGAFSKIRSSAFEEGAETAAGSADNAPQAHRSTRRGPHDDARLIEHEVREAQRFHSGRLEVEVWFVALGAEYAGNGGMKAFLAEHGSELRGSVIFNLDSLGAGTFTYVDSEGEILQKTPSTRLNRYIKNAQAASGVSITRGSIKWRDSAVSVAMKRGLQGITLAGMDGAKPAMMGQGDDVLENIDANAMESRISFIEAIIRAV